MVIFQVEKYLHSGVVYVFVSLVDIAGFWSELRSLSVSNKHVVRASAPWLGGK